MGTEKAGRRKRRVAKVMRPHDAHPDDQKVVQNCMKMKIEEVMLDD